METSRPPDELNLVLGTTPSLDPAATETVEPARLFTTKGERNLAITGWALFDLAMTIFSLNIISRYFSLWVSKDNNQPDIVYSVTFSISLAIVAISSPALGAISDRAGR